MLGYIKGKVLYLETDQVTILTSSGVGYEVFINADTRNNLHVNDEIELWTAVVYKQDAMEVFGFKTIFDKQLFKKITKVSGIGPKLGISILSSLNSQIFVNAINAGDVDMLTKIPGVGKKTAQRMVIELQNKLTSTTSSFSNANKDAYDALVALGFKPATINPVLEKLAGKNLSSQDIIKKALQML